MEEELTRDLLITEFESILVDMLQTMKAKNHDYAVNNPFDNFELCEKLGVTNTENGMFVRMLDKVSRLSTFLQKEDVFAVKSESFHDTCLDLAVYSLLLSIRVKYYRE